VKLLGGWGRGGDGGGGGGGGGEGVSGFVLMGSTGEPDRKRRHFSSISSPPAAMAKKQPFSHLSEDKKVGAFSEFLLLLLWFRGILCGFCFVL